MSTMQRTDVETEEWWAYSSNKMQARRLAELKRRQREQDEADLKILRDTFACVKYEPEDLDGLSWNTPAAQAYLLEMNAWQAMRESAKAQLANANSKPGVSTCPDSASPSNGSDADKNLVSALSKEEQSRSAADTDPVDAGIVFPSMERSEIDQLVPSTPPTSPTMSRDSYFFLNATPKSKHRSDDDDEDVERTPHRPMHIRTDDSNTVARGRSRDISIPFAFDIMKPEETGHESMFARSTSFSSIYSAPPPNTSPKSMARIPNQLDLSLDLSHPSRARPKVKLSPPSPVTQPAKAKTKLKPRSHARSNLFSPDSSSLDLDETMWEWPEVDMREDVFAFESPVPRSRSPSPSPRARRAALSSSTSAIGSVLGNSPKLNKDPCPSPAASTRVRKADVKVRGKGKARGASTTRSGYKRNGVVLSDEHLLLTHGGDVEEAATSETGGDLELSMTRRFGTHEQ